MSEASSAHTTYLVTGASRGLGRSLVRTLLLRTQTTVIATVRDLTSLNTRSLEDLPKATGSRLIVEKIDATSRTDALEAVQRLRSNFGITTLDVAIANAGIAKYPGLAHEVPVEEVTDHFEINAIGPLLLFQAVKPLLDAAERNEERVEGPIFVAVSSVVASITDAGSFPLPNTPYASSKAAFNFIMRKIHYENPRLIALTLHPGWIQSDMGNAAATRAGLPQAPVPIDASVSGILYQIDKATRTEHGQFLSYDGTELKW